MTANIQILRSTRFERKYKKLTGEQQAAVDEALKRFGENPRHPSLHFEVLLNPYCSIRVDIHWRIIIRAEKNNRFALVDVGDHNVGDYYGRKKRR